MKNARRWNRALLIAARSRQPAGKDFSKSNSPSLGDRCRPATAASNLDAGCHGQTVRNDEGFRSSRASTCVARSRLATFKTWRDQLARPGSASRSRSGHCAVDLRISPLPWASNYS
jgi:hypothetical protein